MCRVTEVANGRAGIHMRSIFLQTPSPCAIGGLRQTGLVWPERGFWGSGVGVGGSSGQAGAAKRIRVMVIECAQLGPWNSPNYPKRIGTAFSVFFSFDTKEDQR